MPEAMTEIPWQLSVTAACAIALVLLVLGSIVDFTPTLLGCLIRGKENINLFNNVKMKLTRNRILMACLPAFFLILGNYPFHPMLGGEPMGRQFLLTAAIMAGYLLVRLLCQPLFFNRTMRQKEFRCGVQVFYTFCVAAMLAILVEFGICRICCVENETVAAVIKWTFAALYAVFLIREFQVFSAHRGYLAAFLYLCGLEILPAGALAASYFVF